MSLPKGSSHPSAKITEDQAREIKQLLKQGDLTQSAIAALYGVDRTTISNIKTGKAWGHVRLRTSPNREPVTCTHKRVRHEHGMRDMYQKDGCRCDKCRKAHAEEMTRRRKAIAYGRHRGFQPVGPVREHLRKLRALGVSDRRISKLTGLSHSAQYMILYRMADDGVVTARTYDSVMGIPLSMDAAAETSKADGVGTARRVRALVALGWTQGQIAADAGVSNNTVARVLRSERVAVGVARKIAACYDRMWDKVAPPSVARSLALHTAAKHGFVPPLAWDDDEIDDPAARPHGEWRAVA